MTVMKLASRLAFSRDLRQRWRQLSVVGSSFLATAVLLLGVAVWQAAEGADDAIARRSPVMAERPGDAVLDASPRGLVIEGRSDLGQVPVMWLEPRPGHESDPVAVPPGLRALPGPGEGVLSAGLVQRGLTPADFGLRASTAGTGRGGAIGDDGLATRSEGWIYARPSEGRTLGVGGTLLPLRGYLTDGPGAENRLNQETFPDLPSGSAAMVGVLWLVVGPALYLALGAARSLSELRLSRSATLFRLGVASRRIRAVLAMETALLSLVGSCAGLLLWLWAGQTAKSVPLTGTTVLPGALRMSPIAALILAGAFVICVAIVGSVGDIRAGRNSPRRRSLRRWHVLPLLASIAAMVASRAASPMSGASAYLLFGGVILCLASLPLAVPFLVQRASAALTNSQRPHVWLAGRRLQFDPATFARPAAAVAALVLIAGAAFAIHGRITGSEPDHGGGGVVGTGHIGQVNWRDERPGDIDWAAKQLSPVVASPTGTDRAGARVAVVNDCPSISDVMGASRQDWCTPHRNFTERGVRDFLAATHLSPRVTPAADVRLDGYNLLLLSTSRIDQKQVMRALTPRLPAVNTTSDDRSTRFVPVGWLIAGWVLASMLLCAAVIREVGDRALASLRRDHAVERLGLDRAEVDAVHRWSILMPVAVAAPVGYVSAVVFALLGYHLGFTVKYLGRITAITVGVWAVATCTLLLVLYLHRKTVSRRY